ncbi:uncharacterized protein FSUBG_8358 [Fusarium subglutinans]|uniref:Kelch repeat protein n=1 Tax=Gibberella subglutinans TaxID=42677 RepID=A0A8H5UTK7_GIBSU|nr:uncharacterized protein FSUBG_8358 [Fusarium subglutinans]KAF5597708.1 hypothetical protein FSUBG_8358 [Fusarium subglutinans]
MADGPTLMTSSKLTRIIYSNTWLTYHDLNNLVERGGDLWSNLNINLSKNDRYSDPSSSRCSSSRYADPDTTAKFTQAASLIEPPRAQGVMVWIPAGDSPGLLVYLGGIFDPYGNNTEAPQAFDEVFVFDAKRNSWSNQKTTGEISQNRRQFCVDVAWVQDNPSFSIYLWGGLSVQTPVIKATLFNATYILTLQSFIWVKAYPGHRGNATLPPEYDHYSAPCNKSNTCRNSLSSEATYTDTNACDPAGNNETYWAIYNPNITNKVELVDAYNITGGNKKGAVELVATRDRFHEVTSRSKACWDVGPE